MKKKRKKNQLFIFYNPSCLQKYVYGRPLSIRVFSFGRALWADRMSPRMNTIASRDQFKPIRTGENLVANYNTGYVTKLNLCEMHHSSIQWSNIAETFVPTFRDFHFGKHTKYQTLKYG